MIRTTRTLVLCLCVLMSLVHHLQGYFHFTKFGSVLKSRSSASLLEAAPSSTNEDKSYVRSRLLPPVSKEEYLSILAEFNITSFDVDTDPDFAKFKTDKSFFEQYGTKNMTEQYSFTVQDVKSSFYSLYNTPLLPQYKTFLSDLMVVTHLQTTDARFKYDALFAFGICTQYYTIMKGYTLQDEVRQFSSTITSNTIC